MRPVAACCCRGSDCSWLCLRYIFVFWSETEERPQEETLEPSVDMGVLRLEGFVLCYRQL